MKSGRLFLWAIGVGLLGVVIGILIGTQRGTLHGQNAETKTPFLPGDHRHPLDPLTADEQTRAVAVVREKGDVGDKVFFPIVTLHEPSKQEVYRPEAGRRPPRQAFVVTFDRPANQTVEHVVDLAASRVVSRKELKGVQPAMLMEEWDSPGNLVRRHPDWIKAMERRNISPETVQLGAWAAGPHALPGRPDHRVYRVIGYLRDKTNNSYPHPVEGVVALVDMTREEVIRVIDRDPIVPVPKDSGDFFDPEYLPPARTGVKPLVTRQPEGASYEIRGHEVRWQNWRFRVGLHPREGLVLHTVGYQDGSKLRPILYRGSLSEMVVPYADPDTDMWSWRNAFDVGEYGLGQLVTPLRLGQEVPAHATLLPATLAGESGLPREKKSVIALYEQDGGILWTHTDDAAGRTSTRRARELVVFTLFTVGNYDYALKWVFGQDGALTVEVELTGIGLVKAVTADRCPVCQAKPDDLGRLRSTGEDRHGKLVGRGLVATNHQHFFCFRLDFDVDGVANSVQEMNVIPDADAGPDGNAFLLETTLLRTEREAKRRLDGATHRSWKVVNPGRANALGHPSGYKLEPGVNATPLARPESKVRQRAGMLDHHLWVTPHRPGELYAAGDYPNMSKGGDGLPKWTAGNADVTNRDVVLWYVMGVTHVARVEEWPVMPAARANFRLLPDSFFDRNPALDVPDESR